MSDLDLPQIIEFERDWNRSNNYGYSDHYGALHVAEEYCRRNGIREKFKFCWQHGCHGPWENRHPGQITYNLESKEIPFFVARKDQEKFLRKCGYANVTAIGLPIIYLPKRKYTRIERSLLIMPPHRLKSMNFDSSVMEREYIESVTPYLPYFKRIAVCLHKEDIELGCWVPYFKRLGIEIISGAQINDKNSLVRQQALFSQFETITTNSWGSHIAYALYYGCKVSIFGPNFKVPHKEYIKDGTWARNPEVLKVVFSDELLAERKKTLKKFYVDPISAVADQQMGRFLVGYNHKQNLYFLYLFFGNSKFGRVFKKINCELRKLLFI